jgi:hypothetical protein
MEYKCMYWENKWEGYIAVVKGGVMKNKNGTPMKWSSDSYANVFRRSVQFM